MKNTKLNLGRFNENKISNKQLIRVIGGDDANNAPKEESNLNPKPKAVSTTTNSTTNVSTSNPPLPIITNPSS
jgi:natural product precursor